MEIALWIAVVVLFALVILHWKASESQRAADLESFNTKLANAASDAQYYRSLLDERINLHWGDIRVLYDKALLFEGKLGEDSRLPDEVETVFHRLDLLESDITTLDRRTRHCEDVESQGELLRRELDRYMAKVKDLEPRVEETESLLQDQHLEIDYIKRDIEGTRHGQLH